MKICFVCNDYPPGPHGGIGTMTQVLGRALAAAGEQVRVIGMYPATYPAPDRHADGAIDVWRLREAPEHFGWVRARLALWKQISRWAHEGQIDVIEVPDYQGVAAGWRALPVPVVCRLHGSSTYFAAEMNQPIDGITSRIEGASLRRVDAWASVSRYTAEKTKHLFGLEKEPAAILYNPIETAGRGESESARGLRVVFSGTLVEKKGVVPLVQAWPGVLESVAGAELHIYGKDGRVANGGSMRAHLESLLPERARASVTFHGHVTRTDLFAALATAGVAIFPSYAEAFAVAPLEAMTCGVPTIYSTRGSGPELMRDGVEGILVDPDRPHDIGAAIVRVLTDPSFARSLGRAGRERVLTAFSLKAILPRNLEFYRQAIANFRRG